VRGKYGDLIRKRRNGWFIPHSGKIQVPVSGFLGHPRFIPALGKYTNSSQEFKYGNGSSPHTGKIPGHSPVKELRSRFIQWQEK